MVRRICPELYPDPRPSRMLLPLLLLAPRALHVFPWVAGILFALVLAGLLLVTLPLLTWVLVCAALLAPLCAGVAFFRYGWQEN